MKLKRLLIATVIGVFAFQSLAFSDDEFKIKTLLYLKKCGWMCFAGWFGHAENFDEKVAIVFQVPKASCASMAISNIAAQFKMNPLQKSFIDEIGSLKNDILALGVELHSTHCKADGSHVDSKVQLEKIQDGTSKGWIPVNSSIRAPLQKTKEDSLH